MKSRDFCYWLQGFFELEQIISNTPEVNKLTEKQVACIRNHLAMVFKHEIDPSFGPPDTVAELSRLHEGGILGGGDVKFNC